MIMKTLGLGAYFLDIAKLIYPNNKDIQHAADVSDKVRNTYNVMTTTSVHESSRQALIAPMIAIEKDVLHAEYMSDLMQVIQLRDIVAVLTHLKIQGASTMGLQIKDHLGQINPARGGLMALEGLENLSIYNRNKAEPKDKDQEEKKNQTLGGEVKTKEIMEYAPLAVGKTVTASIYNENGGEIKFPLTFRSVPIPMTYTDLLNVFKSTGIAEHHTDRNLKRKLGMITTPELLSGKDIIKEKFRIANSDMSRYYKEATKRESNNKAAAVRTGVVSMNSLANAFVVSQDSMNMIELEVGKRLDTDVGRETIFKAVKANLIVVCNEDRGIFTFYSIASNIPEVYTRKELRVKSNSKDNNTLEELVSLLGN